MLLYVAPLGSTVGDALLKRMAKLSVLDVGASGRTVSFAPVARDGPLLLTVIW